VTDEEIEEIRNHPDLSKARNPAAYLETLGKKGDLADLLEQLRAGRKQAGRKRHRAEIGTMPPCEHGAPGGSVPDPETGLPWTCFICRKSAEQEAERDP